MSDPVFFSYADEDVVQLNDAAQKYTGWEATSSSRDDAIKFFVCSDENVSDYLKNTMFSDTHGSTTVRLRQVNGRARWHLVRGTNCVDVSGIVRRLVVCTDVHHLVVEQTARQDMVSLIKALCAAASIDIFQGGVPLDIISYLDNPADTAAISGQVNEDRSPRLSDERLSDLDDTNYPSKSAVPLSWVRSDGDTIDLAIKIRTSYQLEADSSASSQNLFHDLFRSLPCLAWVTDEHGTLTHRNGLWSSYTGLPDTQSDPLGFDDLIDSVDFRTFEEAWDLAVAQQTELHISVRLHDIVCGNRVPHSIVVLPRRDQFGRAVGWIGTAVREQS